MTKTDELVAVAREIRQWQTERGISDSQLCRAYAGLGSPKTYTRILAGQLEQLDVEKWLNEYRAVRTLLEIEQRTQAADESLIPTLPNCVRTLRAVRRAMESSGLARLVILEGPPGAGKTTALKLLAQQFGRRVVIAEADEFWARSLHAMLRGLCRALRIEAESSSPHAMRDALLTRLSATRTCVCIDDAHHASPATLNLYKTLINQTPGELVLAGVDTIMSRMEREAYQEARQLINRLSERVRFELPEPTPVEKFLAQRGIRFADGETAKRAAKFLAERARMYTHWHFVARVAAELSGDGVVDQEDFATAVRSVTERFAP